MTGFRKPRTLQLLNTCSAAFVWISWNDLIFAGLDLELSLWDLWRSLCGGEQQCQPVLEVPARWCQAWRSWFHSRWLIPGYGLKNQTCILACLTWCYCPKRVPACCCQWSECPGVEEGGLTPLQFGKESLKLCFAAFKGFFPNGTHGAAPCAPVSAGRALRCV